MPQCLPWYHISGSSIGLSPSNFLFCSILEIDDLLPLLPLKMCRIFWAPGMHYCCGTLRDDCLPHLPLSPHHAISTCVVHFWFVACSAHICYIAYLVIWIITSCKGFLIGKYLYLKLYSLFCTMYLECSPAPCEVNGNWIRSWSSTFFSCASWQKYWR